MKSSLEYVKNPSRQYIYIYIYTRVWSFWFDSFCSLFQRLFTCFLHVFVKVERVDIILNQSVVEQWSSTMIWVPKIGTMISLNSTSMWTSKKIPKKGFLIWRPMTTPTMTPLMMIWRVPRGLGAIGNMVDYTIHCVLNVLSISLIISDFIFWLVRNNLVPHLYLFFIHFINQVSVLLFAIFYIWVWKCHILSKLVNFFCFTCK